MSHPRLTVLGGPNGAGKTTLAQSGYADLLATDRFLNADEIASEIAPDAPSDVSVAASRRLIRLRREWIDCGFDFVLESTLASRGLLQALRHAADRKYHIALVYIWVSDPDICIQRVADRVSRGGHYIPPDTVKRRYALGLRLLPDYLGVADDVDIFDADGFPALIARRRQDRWITYDRGNLPEPLSNLI